MNHSFAPAAGVEAVAEAVRGAAAGAAAGVASLAFCSEAGRGLGGGGEAQETITTSAKSARFKDAPFERETIHRIFDSRPTH
jgi:hypothetical protein